MSKSRKKSEDTDQPKVRPIVLDLSDQFREDDEDTVEREGKAYSDGLADAQDIFVSMVDVSARVAKAVAKGLETYLDANEKSAKNKKDGTVRDLGINSAKGLSESLRELSLIPVDIAKKLDTESTQEAIDRQLKNLAKTNKRIGLE